MRDETRPRPTQEDVQRFTKISSRIMIGVMAIGLPVFGYFLRREVINSTYNNKHKDDIVVVQKTDDSTLVVRDNRFTDIDNTSDENPEKVVSVRSYLFAKNKGDSLRYAAAEQSFAELIADNGKLVTHRFSCGCTGEGQKIDTLNIALR